MGKTLLAAVMVILLASGAAFALDEASKHYNRALAYEKNNDYPKAIKEYEAAIELNPGKVEAYNNLARMYYAQGKLIDAKQTLEKAIALKTDYANAIYNLGKVYEALGYPE
ncbi:MAG: tetratricopeptide repeat protein, partial [Candidatus Omnitrophota bacterium]